MVIRFYQHYQKVIILVCIGLMLASCTTANVDPYSQPDPISPTNTSISLTETIATLTRPPASTTSATPIPPSATPSSAPTSEARGISVDSQTKLLLNVTSDQWVGYGMCYPPGTTEVWLLPFPFEQYMLFLSDPIANFFAPTWSPDGQWIAYIESKPVVDYLRDVNLGTPSPPGTDSVWIMKADGSEKQRISPNLDSVDFQDPNFCYRYSQIVPILDWSPDGRYIHFDHRQLYVDGMHTDHYIIHLESQNTYQVTSIPGMDDYVFAWGPEDGEYILLDRESQAVWIGTVGEDGLKQERLPDPPFPYGSVAWPAGQIGPLLTNSAGQESTYTVWAYDLDTAVWVKQWEDAGLRIDIGSSWGVIADHGGTVSFVNQEDWLMNGSIPVDSDVYDFYFYFPRLRDVTGEEIISLLDNNNRAIWVVDPNDETHTIYPLVDLERINPESDHWIMLSWGISWYP